MVGRVVTVVLDTMTLSMGGRDDETQIWGILLQQLAIIVRDGMMNSIDLKENG